MEDHTLYNPKHCVTSKNGSCLDEDLIRKVAKIFNKNFSYFVYNAIIFLTIKHRGPKHPLF